VRLHVPITTNPRVRFRLNGRRIVMEPGDLWYLRLSDPHRVTNEGATDRVHLVVDAVANEWMERLFDEAFADATRRAAAR
jgi:quercetin dioxygenase-like cupin family protein